MKPKDTREKIRFSLLKGIRFKLMLLSLAGILFWWFIGRWSAGNEWDITTLTVPVQEEAVNIRITASGVVQPVNSVNVSPKDSGLIAELLVEQGDFVEARQPIALMESAELEADVESAEARVARAVADLEEVRAGSRIEEIAQANARVIQAEALADESEARLALANERLERNLALAQEGAISQDELDGIRNEVTIAEAELRLQIGSLQESVDALSLSQSGSRSEDVLAAEADLAEAEAELKSARVRLENTIVRAPFSGIVTQRFASVGAFVTPTTSASDSVSATSTAIVALADGIEVMAEVPEVSTSLIQLDQTVEIVADAFPEEVFEGRVKLIAPEAVVEENITLFQVRVELSNGDEKLLSGMNVNTTFINDENSTGLVVPTVSIVTLDGRRGVLVPDSRDRPRFRAITIGSSTGNFTQVLSGLESGDLVFTDLPTDINLDNLNFGDNENN
ncbi:MAG: efflux RND transporter periplasmic adaptor subunit [Cyanobacteria bacterium P01_E01_bin.6]